jgi:hypothetical protein
MGLSFGLGPATEKQYGIEMIRAGADSLKYTCPSLTSNIAPFRAACLSCKYTSD